MEPLKIGERVRVLSNIPSSLDHVGRIVQILEPFVASQLKEQAFLELPVYSVRLEDGRNLQFRGRDLTRD